MSCVLTAREVLWVCQNARKIRLAPTELVMDWDRSQTAHQSPCPFQDQKYSRMIQMKYFFLAFVK